MNSKVKQLKAMLIVTSLLCVGLIALNGCKKSEPTPSETSDTMQEMQGHEGHEHEQMAMMDEPAKEIASAVEQTACPIMESNAINKALFAEYKGKKVYFCCPECVEKFDKEPEKYIAKLPQFKQ
ncbi:MAG: YHS domain-containing protein [Planctomycetes bacterium]|nr:YHS domain-containing protein [Planctomycetota bacterium]